MADPDNVTPRPDPTVLTTEQLRREIATLREIIDARLNGMDKTHSLLASRVDGWSTESDFRREALKELLVEKLARLDERFHSIDKLLAERDVRTNKSELAQKEFAAAQAAAAGVANTVALSAQKEQSASQAAFFQTTMQERQNATTKQIDAIQLLVAQNTKTSDDKIAALSSRLDRGEGLQRGSQDYRTEARLNVGAVFGMISGVVGVLALFLSIGVLVVNNHQGPSPTVVSPAVIPVTPR
jgi:hypothetical protein